MQVAIPLRVEGIRLDDEETITAIDQRLDEALWASVDGSVTATLFVAEAEAVDAAVEFARHIVNTMPGARVRRVHRELVNTSDIAQRTGFSRETVRKWAVTQSGFPTPDNTVGSGTRRTRIWQWPDVAAWLHDRYAYPLDDDQPSEGTIAHIDAALCKVPDYLTNEWQQTDTPAQELVELPISVEWRVVSVRYVESLHTPSTAAEMGSETFHAVDR